MSNAPNVPDAILVLLNQIHTDLQEVKGEQKKMGEILTDHINTEPKEWAEQLRQLMKDSFPDGDADGHRKAHEYAMKQAADRSEFWSKMTYELTKWTLIGFLAWTAVSLVQAAANHLHEITKVVK